MEKEVTQLHKGMIIKCESCGKTHDGSYGSGRFCNRKCASTYSSNVNSEQKGRKISIIMKNRWKNGGHFSDIEKLKTLTKNALDQQRINRENLFKFGEWDDLPLSFKKRRVMEEQNNRCLKCNIKEWYGKSLILHYDHIDGNNKNNKRENVRYLCPNCHSQTETYCGNKQKLPQYEYLKTTKNKAP